jgi:hypothetical protein
MTALVQGCSGLALVMGLAMLCARQPRAVFFCLVAQSALVAGAAVASHQPLMMLGPLVTTAAIGGMRRATAFPAVTAGGVVLGLVAGGILVLLCQSCGDAGVALGVVMVAIVLAATRADRVTQVLALGAMQNGLALTGCAVGDDALLPFAGVALVLPLAGSLLPRSHGVAGLAWRWSPGYAARWPGWAELIGAAGLFAASLTVPLDPLASVFAPLIAFDGLVRAWIVRRRGGVSLGRRLTTLTRLGCILLAVCSRDPILAWLAVVAAATVSLLPTASRQWDRAVLAYVGAGLGLLGLLIVPVDASPVGFLGLFAGYAMLAAATPNLAIPLLVLVLRLADQADWPDAVGSLGTGIALAGLLTCSFLLIRRRRFVADYLLLAQVSIAAMGVASLQADGRFAAVVLLVLLSLTRTASQAAGGPAGMLAIAGLAGLPPLGVFPGLVLVVLAVCGRSPWLLVGVGAALMPVLLAGLPAPGRRWMASGPAALLSVGWLPLSLAALFGFFAPTELVRWLSALTAGPS